MSASKTSAVADEPIEVLFALHPKFDLLDFAGPAEVFTTALHDWKDDCKSSPGPPALHWAPIDLATSLQGV
jgi:transcriptional regulator GlxA family with amidase domain